MVTISEKELIEFITPQLKKEGFKKIKTTWRKPTEDVMFVLNIQQSQWDHNDYYTNVAVYINALGQEVKPPEYRCHIRNRIANEHSCEAIYREIISWFEKHGDIQKLKELNQLNKLESMTTMEAEKYLDER